MEAVIGQLRSNRQKRGTENNYSAGSINTSPTQQNADKKAGMKSAQDYLSMNRVFTLAGQGMSIYDKAVSLNYAKSGQSQKAMEWQNTYKQIGRGSSIAMSVATMNPAIIMMSMATLGLDMYMEQQELNVKNTQKGIESNFNAQNNMINKHFNKRRGI